MEIDGVKMNELETAFYNAYMDSENDCDYAYELRPQAVIGPYKVDFACMDCVIEIDGHEYHKTKEQRDYDYKRERYLMLQGYFPIRFTGTEVFLDPVSCVREASEIIGLVAFKEVKSFCKGQESVYKKLEGGHGEV